MPSLLRDIRQGVCRILVLDPSGAREDAFAEVISATALAMVSMIIYAPLTPSTVRQVLLADAVMGVEVVFRGTEDGSWLLRTVVRHIGALSAPARVLSHIGDRLQRLPLEMVTPTVGLFGWLPLPRSAERFSLATRRSLRTVERHFRAAGLSSPRRMLHIARIARAHVLIRNPATKLSEAAARVGYQSNDVLSFNARNIVGVSARGLADSSNRDAIIGRLADAATDASREE